MMSAKDKKKGSQVPRLRFPEFQDAGEWAKIQLSKIAIPVSERATDGDADAVLTLSAEHGVVTQGAYFGKKVAGNDVRRYIRIKNNDFVYNDRTTKLYKYGTIKRLSRHAYGIVSPIYKCFRFNHEEIPVFWEWYFESGEHDAQIHSIINEGAKEGRFNISIQKFLSIFVYFPKRLEQQRIADCLSSLDERITTETSKLDTLKDHKKGLLKQLFPAEGETTPELRFPGFTGNWKEKKLSRCVKLISGIHLSPTEYGSTGEVPYFSGPSDFVHDILICYKWSKDLRSVALENDILVTVKGSGVGELWCLKLPRVAIGRQLMAIRAENCVYQFLYQALGTRKGLFEALGSGNLIPGLSRNDILDMKFYFPSISEQQRIADCLSSLDELIAAQTQKIDLLKDHKKGLMQQLFPHIDEVRA